MHIDLKLGLSCNNYCRHCIMEPIRQNLLNSTLPLDTSPEAVADLIAGFAPDETPSVTLTGGEPTLRADFFPILRSLMEKGMVITVQTNARLLGTPKAKESLAALPNRAVEFVVALHGPTPAIHDNITRVPGSFTETLAAIDTLARLDFPVIGKMVLSRHNVQAIEPTLRLLAERGVLEALVAFPHAEEFSYTALTDVLPDYEQVRTALSVLPDPTCSMRTVYWETIPFCVLPGVDFFPYSIDLTYLKEKTHNRDSEINMTMTEQKILWEPSRKTSKAHAPQCGQCLLEHVCEGVWQEYFSLYTNDALRPIDDAVLVDTFIASLS